MHDSNRAFETASQGSRKVIIATNIAETSVTIEGVKFVVDAGLVKTKYFNVVSGIDALMTCPIAQSSANQRAGRAGRTAPGKCYRLMTEPSFSKLDLFNTPEMQRTDITWAVLQLKALGIDDVIHFDFLAAPYLESLNYSLELLYSLGALDLDCELTGIGEKMSGTCYFRMFFCLFIEHLALDCSQSDAGEGQGYSLIMLLNKLDFQPSFRPRKPKNMTKMHTAMPVEPRLAKCLLSSLSQGCTEEMLSVAAMCSVEYPHTMVSTRYQGVRAMLY